MSSRKTIIITLLAIFGLEAQSHMPVQTETLPALVDLKTAEELGLPIFDVEEVSQVAFTWLTPEQAQLVSDRNHLQGKCAGFEALPELKEQGHLFSGGSVFGSLAERVAKDTSAEFLSLPQLKIQFNNNIHSLINQVQASNIRDFVTWFSSFENRYNKGPNANVSVSALKERVESLMRESRLSWSVEEIAHRSTPQKTLKLTIPGSKRPNEIIVIGGHGDSIASWGMGKIAPGADDNASGSGSIFEAIRVLSQAPQPERTLEFYWYAGEESGLLGSNEIATSYKQMGKTVIAVLQLDMTAFKGLGSNKIASMTDFTSTWLRNYLAEVNQTYLGLEIVSDKCGYGCSDHASWYRQGYPTLMPFEASMGTMNKNIHTPRDLIQILDFEHAAHFSKIAVLFGSHLANSDLKETN